MEQIEIEKIETNPFQPRSAIDEGGLEEMVSSIKRFGILQPILVRVQNEKYQIAAGERRYRAAQRAGMKSIPVIEKQLTDREMLEIAMIENMHREDMSPIDKAEGFKKLIEDFKMTQAELSVLFGISRSAIANTIRLLGLPSEARVALERKEITEGHARAILGIENKEAVGTLLKHIKEKHMSVRECENITREISRNISQSRINEAKSSEHEEKYEEMLTEAFKTRVRVTTDGKKKKIEIEIYSWEEVERIIELVKG